MSRRKRKWAKNEDVFLKEFFHKLNINDLTEQLNNINTGLQRTQGAIISRAYKIRANEKKPLNVAEAMKTINDLIKNGMTIEGVYKKTKIPMSIINDFFKNNNVFLDLDTDKQKKYYETEDDILKEYDLLYNPKELKGWELEQYKKL